MAVYAVDVDFMACEGLVQEFIFILRAKRLLYALLGEGEKEGGGEVRGQRYAARRGGRANP